MSFGRGAGSIIYLVPYHNNKIKPGIFIGFYFRVLVVHSIYMVKGNVPKISSSSTIILIISDITQNRRQGKYFKIKESKNSDKSNETRSITLSANLIKTTTEMNLSKLHIKCVSATSKIITTKLIERFLRTSYLFW